MGLGSVVPHGRRLKSAQFALHIHLLTHPSPPRPFTRPFAGGACQTARPAKRLHVGLRALRRATDADHALDHHEHDAARRGLRPRGAREAGLVAADVAQPGLRVGGPAVLEDQPQPLRLGVGGEAQVDERGVCATASSGKEKQSSCT